MMAMETKKFNVKGYERSLEETLRVALDSMQDYVIGIPSYQMGIIKTYLWIAATIIGANSAVVLRINLLNNDNILAIIFLASSIIFALAAFIFAIDTMRGRLAAKIPDISSISKLAHQVSFVNETGEKDFSRITFLTSMIAKIDDVNFHNKITIDNRGKKLRDMSVALVLSVIMGFSGVLLVIL